MRHRLDLGPNMLPGAQQHTTVESAAALRIQEKIKGKYDCHDLKEDLMGTKFFIIFVKYVVYDWG